MLVNLRCLVGNITFEVCVATSSLYTTMVTAVASRYVYLKFLITSFVIIRSCLSNVMTSLCIFLATNISGEYSHKHTTANTVFVSPLSERWTSSMLMIRNNTPWTFVNFKDIGHAQPVPDHSRCSR